MKKTNGFTLIELLAVIVILAIIALIATPLAINVINQAKENSFKNTAYGLIDGIRLLSAEQQLNGASADIIVHFENGQADNALFKVSGDVPDSGTIHMGTDGKIELKVWSKDLGKCAEKAFTESQVKYTETTEEECKIDIKATEITGKDGQFKYIILANGKIQVSRYLGSETEVVIPATYDGYQVYSVGNVDATNNNRYHIFGATNSKSNSTVKKVTISEGIEVIETAAFSKCKGLTGTLTLPSTLKRIETAAFNQCSNLTGDLVIPNGVTYIGDVAFQACDKMTGTLTLSNTLETIGLNAFYRNPFTGDLTIPDSVKVIDYAAFSNCTKFDGILTLPKNVEVIGDFAFNHCSGFKNTTLDIPTTVKRIGENETDGTHIFYDFATKTIANYTMNGSTDATGEKFKVVDGVILNTDGTRFIAYPASKVGNTYEMPEGITIIDELSFSRAGSTESGVPETGLKKLILPNSLLLTTTLPSNYLNKGNNLAVGLYQYIGVNEIGVKDDNPNYKTIDGNLYSKDGTILWYVPMAKSGAVVVAEGTTTIKSGTFYQASLRSLTSVTIPASVTEIEATELTELKTLGSSKVTFAEGSIYEFKSDGTVGKKE